jgi:hypothetical protein
MYSGLLMWYCCVIDLIMGNCMFIIRSCTIFCLFVSVNLFCSVYLVSIFVNSQVMYLSFLSSSMLQ